MEKFNEMQESFLEVNEAHRKSYGHMLEGVKHRTNDSRLNTIEQNKLGILIDNAVRGFAAEHRMPRDSANLETIRESMTMSSDAVAFITGQLPLIRNVFNNSIIRDLVSIQPMQTSVKKVHYWDIVREDASSTSANINANRNYSNNEEYNPDDPTAIKTLKAKLTGSTIECTEKKLGAEWTVEAEQDIMAEHGIGLEGELSNEIGASVVREWDYTIINKMFDEATGGSVVFDQTIPAGITYTDRKVWMEGLYEKMIDLDTAMFVKTFKRTNWILTTPLIAAFIEKMAGFVASSVSPDQQIIATGGRYYTGTLASRWRVYVDPYLTTSKMLMGYNGTSWLDTAFVFAPYILAVFSDTFMNNKQWTKYRSIMSRCGMKVVRPDMIGTLTVSGS